MIYLIKVVPFAGTWIEIRPHVLDCLLPLSFPSRERGLKWPGYSLFELWYNVVPFAGTWIEIVMYGTMGLEYRVVPFAGTWIEIFICLHSSEPYAVVPFAGTWIEIDRKLYQQRRRKGRSLRGNVD